MTTAFEGLEKILSDNLSDYIDNPDVKIHVQDIQSSKFKIYIVRKGEITSHMTHHKDMWSTILIGSKFKRHFHDEKYKTEDNEIMDTIIDYLLGGF